MRARDGMQTAMPVLLELCWAVFCVRGGMLGSCWSVVNLTSVPGRGGKQQCLCCWNRTDLGKCSHEDEEKQGDNNTQVLSAKFAFFRCKKITTKRNRNFLSFLFFTSFFFCCLFIFLHPKKTIFVESVYALLFPCFSSYWWVHFPRSVLFCQPHQQLFTDSCVAGTMLGYSWCSVLGARCRHQCLGCWGCAGLTLLLILCLGGDEDISACVSGAVKGCSC